MEKIPKNKLILIQSKSAGFDGGNYAQITINDVPIQVERSETNKYRGLHIIIINPSNGQVT